MTSWIHTLGNDWGHWVRKMEAKNRQVQGTLGRIVDEGPAGAAIRDALSFSQKIPVVDFPEDVSSFHQAWLRLDRNMKLLVWVEYRLVIPFKEKFRLMDKKKDAYYRLRGQAQIAIISKMSEIQFANKEKIAN